jgi:hypothetical protein
VSSYLFRDSEKLKGMKREGREEEWCKAREVFFWVLGSKFIDYFGGNSKK